MIDRNDIFARVRQVIIETIDAPPHMIRRDATLRSDLGADSLDSLEIVMALEETFDIRLTDEAAERLRTVDDLVNFIADAVAARGGSVRQA